MAWQSPKTNWGAADGVRDSDFNRIEGNILELYNVDALRAAKTIYVSTSGNDSTGAGTSASPYRTISKALSTIPKNLNGNTITLSIATGTYAEDVIVKDFCGGLITLSGSSPVTLNSLTIVNCLVKANYLNIVTTGSIGLQATDGAIFLTTGDLTANGTSYGVSATGCSNVLISGAATVTNALTAVNASNKSGIYVSSISGSNVDTVFNASNGSQIAYGSSTVSFTDALAVTSTGGRIFSGAQNSANSVFATATLE